MGKGIMTRCIVQFALTFVILANAAAGVAAQSAGSTLREAIEAMGGESALRRITAREAKGTIRRASDGAQGSFQMLTLKPDLCLLTFNVDGLEVSEDSTANPRGGSTPAGRRADDQGERQNQTVV
jgi:hypothetical protein